MLFNIWAFVYYKTLLSFVWNCSGLGRKVEDWDYKSYIFLLQGHVKTFHSLVCEHLRSPRAVLAALANSGSLCFCDVRMLSAGLDCEDEETGASAWAAQIPQGLGVSAHLCCAFVYSNAAVWVKAICRSLTLQAGCESAEANGIRAHTT